MKRVKRKLELGREVIRDLSFDKKFVQVVNVVGALPQNTCNGCGCSEDETGCGISRRI